MEPIAYLLAIMLYCNVFGSGILALKFIAEEVKEWFSERTDRSQTK
jgi:hypothetical protein